MLSKHCCSSMHGFGSSAWHVLHQSLLVLHLVTIFLQPSLPFSAGGDSSSDIWLVETDPKYVKAG